MPPFDSPQCGLLCSAMFDLPVNEALDNLLKHPRIWRARNTAGPEAPRGLPSGYHQLDRHLPGGGWPRHAMTEILVGHHGRGELRLLMPALARLCRAGGEPGGDAAQAGWIAWIAPPFQPYPPALAAWGIDLSRLLVVHPKSRSDTLWAAEQALASGNCAAVLLWPDGGDGGAGSDIRTCRRHDATSTNVRPGTHSIRRLQLAAEKGRSWAVAFRPLEARSEISAAALRLELVQGERGMDVVVLKSRGGSPAKVQNVFHD
jgi:hypothetical protein